MKVNLISDIHASYNPIDGTVMYHLPFKYSKNKYVDAAKALYLFLIENSELLKNITYTNSIVDIYPEYCQIIKNYDDAVEVMKSFYEKCTTNFENVTVEKMWYFSSALSDVDVIFQHNHIDWKKSNKTKLSIDYDLKSFMYKCIGDFDPCKLEAADYLIIAGDLGLDNTYDMILKDIEEKTKGKFKKILHIAGNHDHWWHGIEGMQSKKPDNVNLSRDYYEHLDGDYLFLGCTLWTPISDNSAWKIGRYMNDYRYIPGKFSPYSSSQQYVEQSSWLKQKIASNKDKKIVVFTHHQPFEELTADDYKHNGNDWDWNSTNVNEAYCVSDHSLDDINMNKNIVLWCCGHTHQNFDGMLHDVHVVRNPIGYSDMYGKCPAENLTGTWYNKIIEI